MQNSDLPELHMPEEGTAPEPGAASPDAHDPLKDMQDAVEGEKKK
ncbi:hypothetical protein [Stenotrophomonas sp. YIM B06876]|nr:hypothetical protein [Stenotrophomonas sp. YIM B06876]